MMNKSIWPANISNRRTIFMFLIYLNILGLFTSVSFADEPGVNGYGTFTKEEYEAFLKQYHADQKRFQSIEQIDYDEISNVSLAIRRSPSEVVIGLGRGPAPFMAFLQIFSGAAKNKNLPFSIEGSSSSIGDWLTRDQREMLFAHFDRFIPSREITGDSSILVVDYVISGSSLKAGVQLIREYLAARGRTNRVIPVALINPQYNAYDLDADARIIPLSVRFANRIFADSFIKIAEYDTFVIPIPNPKINLETNPKYQDLTTPMRDFMKTDPKAKSCFRLATEV